MRNSKPSTFLFILFNYGFCVLHRLGLNIWLFGHEFGGYQVRRALSTHRNTHGEHHQGASLTIQRYALHIQVTSTITLLIRTKKSVVGLHEETLHSSLSFGHLQGVVHGGYYHVIYPIRSQSFRTIFHAAASRHLIFCVELLPTVSHYQVIHFVFFSNYWLSSVIVFD